MTTSGWRRLAARARDRVRSRPYAAPGRGPSAAAPSVDSVVDLPQERLNAGPDLDALVARARGNRQPPGSDPDYDEVQRHFDYVHFLLQATLLRESPGADPVRVFLASGVRARNSPYVHFSMSNYMRRYPEKKLTATRSPYLDWIEQGRAAGEIADPANGIEQLAGVLGLEPQAVVDELVTMRTDLTTRLRTGTLGEMFAKAAQVEPLIGEAWAETAQLRLPPFVNEWVARAVAGIHACHRDAGFRKARLLVVTGRPRSDSGRRLAEQLVCSGVVAPEDVVVIYTDGSDGDGSEPAIAGIRQADYFTPTVGVPEEYLHKGLVALLRSFGAEAIINADSTALYQALPACGRPLTASERLFFYFVANQRDPLGNPVGMSSGWLYAGFDLAEQFLTDTDLMKSDLVERYQLTEEQSARIHVLREPVDAAIPVTARPATPSDRPVVGWAGLWDRQRRPELVLEVAREMPGVDFRLWVPTAPEAPVLGDLGPNVRVIHAPFDVRHADLSTVDAWLYTSAWDGAPGIVLDVAMTELPIVGGLVGGVGEVLSAEDSWPVADAGSASAYVDALREILADPTEARRRSGQLRERLLKERPRAAFAEDVERLVLGQRRAGADAS